MKACWLLCTLVLSLSCFSQTSTVKLYGFSQVVAKGVPSTYETDEQGKTVETKQEVNKNLFIYLAYPPDLNLYPVEVWMKGELYSIKQQPAHTPVVIVYANGQYEPETVILVPTTTDTVFQLILTDRSPSKNTTIKKSLAETNDLVVVYKLNGKFYSQTLKKIKGLRMGIMQ